jgi:Ni,Fe-hydrogenase III large subunit
LCSVTYKLLNYDNSTPISAFSYYATRKIKVSSSNRADAGVYNLKVKATKTIGGTLISEMPFNVTLIDPCISATISMPIKSPAPS